MFFKGNESEKLDEALFRDPTSEYRGAPFWAWNSSLDKEELEWEIDVFKKMGLGGFNMHVRQGLETPYMSPEFMEAVRVCAKKAQKEGMYAWAYDEDRWPSGCAGGILTRDKKYRMRSLVMTAARLDSFTTDPEVALNDGVAHYLGSYLIDIDSCGYMTGFDPAEHKDGDGVRHFYAKTAPGGEPRYNGQSYADTMSREAMDKFIDLTYEVYKREVGEYFGGSIPAIFTDEPQTVGTRHLNSGFDQTDAIVPYTPTLAERFESAYGYSLISRLPEIFYASHSDAAAKTRHDFYRLISDLFMESFADNIGKWCNENGIMLTGHALGEDTLYEQLLAGYETMRFYKEMRLPGMDCLCHDKAFTTALQCRSVVNQMKKEGLISELYGVTGWDFGFRGHKFQGDWQACLGVSVRCQHLAWQTMKGEGKRDYPASIFYQSPWYLEYKYLEDHYARVNTVLTRGKCGARVAVIHPLDTYYLKRASNAETRELSDEMDSRFAGLAYTLMTDMIDFDYISESLLPDLCDNGASPLRVGEMEYDLVILCDVETLRPHTLKVLEEYKAAGGKLLFVGNLPSKINAVKDLRAEKLSENSTAISYSPSLIRRELASYKNVFVSDKNGVATRDIIHTERIDGNVRHIFFARTEESELAHIVNERELTVKVRGEYKPLLRDTFSGKVEELPCDYVSGFTVMKIPFFDSDAILLSLEEGRTERRAERISAPVLKEIEAPFIADYEMSEPNVLLLDMPEYSLNGSSFAGPEEIMRIDAIVRESLGLPTRKTKVVQPYTIMDRPEDNELVLRFSVHSEIAVERAWLALENAEKCSVTLNGIACDGEICGYYVDKHIKKIKLGELVRGENVITVTMPFGQRTNLEAMYLLGEFGTECTGRRATLIKLPEKVAFSDLAHQGMRFYGGNVIYRTEIELEEVSDIVIKAAYFKGALVKVSIDGGNPCRIAFSPYTARFGGLSAGKHTVEYELFGNRYNTFSALHTLLADKHRVYIGPDYWRSTGDGWAYEYQHRPFGILKAPEIFKVIK